MIKGKPLIFISPIKKKSVIKSGFHEYSHNCGMSLLKKAFLHIGKELSEDDIVKSDNGKPYLKDNSLFFSISHCDGLAVCVLSQNPVGIDCESVRKAGNSVMKRCYSENETQYVVDSLDSNNVFSRLWTLKESYVKMTGEGIAGNLKTKCFDTVNGRALFESGAVFHNYSGAIDNEYYHISICCKTDDRRLAGKIEIEDFDIDNEHILLYNVSDN